MSIAKSGRKPKAYRVHVLMVTDAYLPMRTSCAVQMHDLGQAFIDLNHQVTLITPVSTLPEKVHIQMQHGIRLVRVRALETKDIPYIQRTFAELINPLLIWHRLKSNREFNKAQYDGVIWYSPNIFWGPLIKGLKRHFKIPSYLILRDIFPDWAVDLGIIKKGPAYLFLKLVEHYQYDQADTIGLQSPNNLKYFASKNPGLQKRLQVLWNWVGKHSNTKTCSIDLSKSPLAGRTLCVYAGNMGKAQGIDALLDLACACKEQNDVGFVIVGRGSDAHRLKGRIEQEQLSNVLLFDEIDSGEVQGLYAQCHIGLVVLDLKHATHNIPGKWVGYLRAGLPTFAIVNPGNDLIELIQESQIGFTSSLSEPKEWSDALASLKNKLKVDDDIKDRANQLCDALFSPHNAIKIISQALQSSN